MRKNREFTTAAVRGIAFGLITLLYTLISGTFGGLLWCVYVGFFLTMAFGAENSQLPNYICSMLAGYVWSFAYVYGHSLLEAAFSMSSTVALVIAETVLTFLLIFVHLKFLSKTWLNKIPAVFAAVATVFAFGGIKQIHFLALSAVIGILMAVGTQVIIDGILKDK